MAFSTLLKERKRKRRHPRTQMRKVFLVAWQGGGHRAGGCRGVSRARNLCLGGIYIDTKDPADEGEILELFFDAPQGEVRTRAIVRSTHMGRGMGVEFIGLNFLERHRLHVMLKALVANEEPAGQLVST
ncbi:MAG TPA: PilZ domain-containing protein [Candidatus Acidoferrales bacterium]|nr:PilZ domain-containing protein [Candidatus Acidoferrales bacterium]